MLPRSIQRQLLLESVKSQNETTPLKLNSEDLGLLLSKVGLSEEKAQALLRALGVDKAGNVPYDEFISWVCTICNCKAAENEVFMQMADASRKLFGSGSRLVQLLMLAEDDITLIDEVTRQAQAARPLVHHEVLQIYEEFLALQRKADGTDAGTYAGMDATGLAQRLLAEGQAKAPHDLSIMECKLAAYLTVSVPSILTNGGGALVTRSCVRVAQVLSLPEDEGEAKVARGDHFRLLAETLLLEANARAAVSGSQAYVQLAAPSAWKGSQSCSQFAEAIGLAVHRLRLPNISDLHMSPSLAFSCFGKVTLEDGEVFEAGPNRVTIHISDQEAWQGELTALTDRLLVLHCPWTSEEIAGVPCSAKQQGDADSAPSILCAHESCIPELLNHKINPVMAGQNLHSFLPGNVTAVQGSDIVDFSVPGGIAMRVLDLPEVINAKGTEPMYVFMRQHFPHYFPMTLTPN